MRPDFSSLFKKAQKIGDNRLKLNDLDSADVRTLVEKKKTSIHLSLKRNVLSVQKTLAESK
ncbi:hypothetical protein AO843_22590 [Lysinibacillus sp. ZYM-1]|nr:hypothetical protein AO843_22590 [Lysinibacillus sp. ZYM-1]